MLIEIHILQNLSPSNPNRDDFGAPKSAYFGGKLRGRISSQCLKRSIRWFDPFREELKKHLGERTKLFPERVRVQLKQTAIPPEQHERIVLVCTRIGKAEGKDTGKKEKEKADGKKRTPQLIYLGSGEVEEFVTRMERLRTEMPEAYKYYLNPVAGFQEVMAAAVEASGLDEKEDKTTREVLVKNAWVIAKLRMDRLANFDCGDEPEPLPERAGSEPGEADATWIVERVELIAAREDAASKTRLKEVLGKVTTKERPQLDEAAPDKPGDYTKFKKMLDVPLQNKSVDIALFGRMTTEAAAFEDVEACLEVAHALSTNEMVREVDYFTAMDDDPDQKGPEAAHLGENQFTSNCYYKYLSLDWCAFVDHLAGGKVATAKSKTEAESLARTALKELIRAAVLAIPTGKKKGHANNNLPEAVLVEVKQKHIPTSYANAFLKPVVPADGDLMTESVRRFGHYVGRVAAGYGLKPQRFWFDLHQQPLAFTPKDGEKEPSKTETLAENLPSFPALLDAVGQALVAAGGEA
jgi:CT1975-like protein